MRHIFSILNEQVKQEKKEKEYSAIVAEKSFRIPGTLESIRAGQEYRILK